MEQPRPRCDGCGGNLEPWEEGPVIYDCFHALHAACASGSDACPRCRTPRTPPIAPPPSPPPPPDSSVAGAVRSNDDAGGDDDDDPSGVVECNVCGGLFHFTKTGFWRDKCPHCMLRPPGSPAWSGSSFGSFGFGSPDLSPPSHADQSGLTASPSGTPAQPSDNVPFGHPPPPTANTFEPPPPLPPQFGPPPPLFQHYSHHAGLFGPPPSFAPPPQHPGQFGCPPASSQPSQGVPIRQPPLAFGNPYFSNFPPVVPPPAPPSLHFSRSLITPPPQPVTAASFNPIFRPMHQPFPFPPPHYPAYQQQPAAGPPSCAACGGAVLRGQTAVTSQCDHTFHFLCFTDSVHACPACGAQWRDVEPVTPPSPSPVVKPHAALNL